jgi:catechol 2,3-dioxygenase-like lactoylglutathione lyase family enzyme
MAVHGISHVAVGVRDMDRSVAFYRDVLGLRVGFDDIEVMGDGDAARSGRQRRPMRPAPSVTDP